MSLSLSNVQQEEFDALVKIEYRSRGFRLRDTIRVRTNIVGSTCQFRKVNQIIANPVGFQTTIALQDPNFTAQTALLQKYAAAAGVDEIQDLTVNFDSRRELAELGAMAIGRRLDQIIINAQVIGGAANVIPAAGSNMTYNKLKGVVNRLFDANAVPLEERFTVLSGSNMASLGADDHFTSRLYTSGDYGVNGMMRMALGTEFRLIPDMTEGGLPLNGTIRTALCWHKMSGGLAIGQDMRTEVNYLPRETTWFVNSLFYGGAVPVDNRGIAQVLCDEAVNP